MRDELRSLGVEELRTAEAVDAAVTGTSGTHLLVVNSVCGCAAGKARPGLALALRHGVRPDRLTSVFAGFDVEATERARGYFPGVRPSSPSMALLRDGWQDDYEGQPAVFTVGCIGLITHAEKLPDGRYNIVLHGLDRFRIVDEDQALAYRRARTETLADAPLVGGWGGAYDATPDWHPLVGRVPGTEGLLICAGWSGHGLKSTPAAGRVMADVVLGTDPMIDVGDLDPARFAEGPLNPCA